MVPLVIPLVVPLVVPLLVPLLVRLVVPFSYPISISGPISVPLSWIISGATLIDVLLPSNSSEFGLRLHAGPCLQAPLGDTSWRRGTRPGLGGRATR